MWVPLLLSIEFPGVFTRSIFPYRQTKARNRLIFPVTGSKTVSGTTVITCKGKYLQSLESFGIPREGFKLLAVSSDCWGEIRMVFNIFEIPRERINSF